MSYLPNRSADPLRLNAFSREVLEALCSHLGADSVFLLYATGDISLRHKLIASVRHFNLRYTPATVRVWPQALSYFPLLEDISFESSSFGSYVAGIDYRMLPTSTKRLTITLSGANSSEARCRFPPPHRTSSISNPLHLDLVKALPNLEELTLGEDVPAELWDDFLVAANILPLSSLEVPYISTEHVALLPSTLCHLTCQVLTSPSPIQVLFPASLESLEILLSTTNLRASILVDRLPGGLKKLLLPSEVDASDIRRLPQSLTHLDLPNLASISHPKDATFPPNLTYLSLRTGSMSSEAIALVPNTVKTLIINSLAGSTPLASLPPGLTEISRFTPFPEGLPSTIKRFVSWSSSKDWRPIVNKTYCGLDDYMDLLPRSLEELNVHGTWTSLSSFCPPPALTRLSLHCVLTTEHLGSEQLMRIVGEQLLNLKSLDLGTPIDMRYLHYIRSPLAELSIRQPPKPVYLALPIFKERSGDSSPALYLDPKQFPHAHKWCSELKTLDIVTYERVVPQWVATLPKTLETLHIHDLTLKHTSGKVLRLLPPKMTSVQLYLGEIGPGDLCSLPKRLQLLQLRCDDSNVSYPKTDLLRLPYGIRSFSIPLTPSYNDPLMIELRKSHMFL